MDLIYVYEAPFVRASNGAIYSVGGNFSSRMFRRYLTVFDRVYVLTRVREEEGTFPENNRVENDRITVWPLAHYSGMFQFITQYRSIQKGLKLHLCSDCAYILRVPSIIGTIMSRLLRREKISYGVEVVGDPYDAFGPNGIKHPFRRFLRWKLKSDLQHVVLHAEASLFVTKKYLQTRYPAATGKFQTYASNVSLPEEAYSEQVRHYNGETKEMHLISVGALAQMYKSPDVVLHAIQKLRGAGIKCRLTWLGDGKYMNKMIQLSRQLGIDDYVSFEGRVNSGQNVRTYLDQADIFLLVSKTEGLPRALIEAMARGLPCVGSRVGGIPELLDENALVPPGNAEVLTHTLKEMIKHSELLNEQSRRNLEVARSYHHQILSQRREAFYRRVKSSVKINC